MSTTKTLRREWLIDLVAGALSYNDINDLPKIRQAINDTCDSFRKDGYNVRDFDQDRTVALIRKALFNSAVPQ